MKQIMLKIEGMTCSACSSGLEKYLKKQVGIIDANINLVMSVATIFYEGITKKEIENYIKEAGFKSGGIFNGIASLNRKQENKIQLILFGILIVLLMYLSMGHMGGFLSLPYFSFSTNPVDYTLLLFFLTIPFMIYARDIFKSGIKNLLHGMPNMDTLVTLSVFCSLFYSIYGMIKIITGTSEFIHNLYFESACMVIYFIKLGRFLESKSHNETRKAIEGLVQITPKKATIKRENKEKVVSIDEIMLGDIIVCKPGEKIAVDGTIIKGQTHIDESFITGESVPILKKKGSKVIAGSISFDGVIDYKAERIGKNSTISEIITMIMNSTSNKNKLARLADKLSSYFVPVIMIVAVLTLLLRLLTGNDFKEALNAFITVLVVACPCSLGLAVPLVSTVTSGLCAKNGLYLKNVEALEKARKIDTVILDKTGTMTYGQLKVHKIFSYDNQSEEELLKIVSSIEKESLHPIATAFSKEETITVNETKNLEGLGIFGKIGKRKYYLGNKKLLGKLNIATTYDTDYEMLVEEGCSILYVIENKKVIGLIGVKDIIRENIKEVVRNLKLQNIEVMMVTGDNEKTAEKIAEEVEGIKVIANVTPIEKSDIVKQLIKRGKKVIMVGDGINDAAALIESTIGISMQNGTDIATDAADVILMNDNIGHLLNFIDISRSAYRIIQQNLFWAFFYNICMIPIAVGILRKYGIRINPMMASIMMTLSSLTVVFNSLRLKKKGGCKNVS